VSAAPLDMAAFAACDVGGAGVGRTEMFPHPLWRAMGAAGLFRIGLPEEHGGAGGGYAAIAAAEADLAEHGGALGFAMSWAGHQLIARAFILGFGNAAQKQVLLPALAAGTSTMSVAISEPDAGAHPKLLRTTAHEDGGDFVLDGEKAWVTNGPIADRFIVLAITAQQDWRKRYSAFLVPRDAPGLTLVEMPPLEALKPSPHCRLRLEACRVQADARLGPPHTAYETMALPFRDIEDAIGLSGTAGLLRFVLRRLAAGTPSSPETAARLGEIAGLAAVLRRTAAHLASVLDGDHRADGGETLVGARALVTHLLGRVQAARSAVDTDDPDLDAALADLVFSQSIARGPRAMKQQRLGEKLRPDVPGRSV
jgi:acyl-CoA dehydrogenase